MDPACLSVNIIYYERFIAMSLYALDNDDSIFAADADPLGRYYCLECFGPVKLRRGRNRVAHFYHVKKSPRCRLYSKSEDHLIVQLQLQKILSGHMESPFLSIQRISDLLWEKEKIAFEIQCSQIQVHEVEKRTHDYAQMGYRVVWLLDDRVFNKRYLRNAEEFLRTQVSYFFTFARHADSFFYDQIEIIIDQKRMKKSPPVRVDFTKPKYKHFDAPNYLPSLLEKRVSQTSLYFAGDLIDKMGPYLGRWKNWEIALKKRGRQPNRWIEFFLRFIGRPYERLLDWLIQKVES